MILIGDIGGTKTHLALIEEKGSEIVFVQEKTFASHKYPSLIAVIQLFLSDIKDIQKACFGVAGPVHNGRCATTNLPWVIDACEISSMFNISQVFLLNDLEANAYGLAGLSPDELYVLNEGEKRPGNAALIAAGTGLGEAGLFWDRKIHHPFACEGGHVEFAPRNDEEIDLLRYLLQEYPHVSYERIVSGSGLYNIYQFLIDTKREKRDDALEKAFMHSSPQEVIGKKGVNNENAACAHALDLFFSVYGAEAGNLALKTLAVSGLYIGGGIAPQLLNKIKDGAFMRAFCDKGRFRSLMQSIPVTVVLNEKTALLGAGRFALNKMK